MQRISHLLVVLLWSNIAIIAWISYTLTEIFKFAKHQQWKPVSTPLRRVHFNTKEHGHGSVWGDHSELSWLVLQVSIISKALVLQLLQNPPRKPPQASPPSLQWCLLVGKSLLCFSQSRVNEFSKEQIKWEWPHGPVHVISVTEIRLCSLLSIHFSELSLLPGILIPGTVLTSKKDFCT